MVSRTQGESKLLTTIVYVKQHKDANTASDGSPIACEDYAVDGYSLAAYLAAFDPAHWTGTASGPLEDARKASSANQRKQIRTDVGANTTMVGVGDVQLTGFTLNIDRVDNVIVRNLQLCHAYDCFPALNGDTWKTEWDNLVVSGSTHVWLDHLTLDDRGQTWSPSPGAGWWDMTNRCCGATATVPPGIAACSALRCTTTS